MSSSWISAVCMCTGCVNIHLVPFTARLAIALRWREKTVEHSQAECHAVLCTA